MTTLIWAQARDRVIGADGGMPWHVPEDLAHFRELTSGGTVVMGRRTWDALDARYRPLPNRRNLVLTRDADWSAEGAEVIRDLEDIPPDAWIIGGATVFDATIAAADRLEITELDLSVDGDTWAPEVGAGWRLSSRSAWEDSSGGVRYRFLTYRRTG